MEEQQYKDIMQYLETLTYPDGYNDLRKTQIRKISTQHFVKNNTLYRKTKSGIQRVVLREQVEPILYHLHQDMSSAHLGIDAVFEKAREKYYWPQMYENVRKYINTCDVCQRRGAQVRKRNVNTTTSQRTIS